VHPQIAWAKLQALRNGAAIASKNFLSRISKILCGDERNEEAAFWAQKRASNVASAAFHAVS
jgi:hypothetical protein